MTSNFSAARQATCLAGWASTRGVWPRQPTLCDLPDAHYVRLCMVGRPSTPPAMSSWPQRSGEISVSAAARLAPVTHKPGLVDQRTAIDAGETTNAGDPGRPGWRPRVRSGAGADQSSVLIHSLDHVAVQLQLADHGSRGVKPSRTQRGKRHRLLTGTTQLLERQTMLNLNQRHQIELLTLRPRPIQGSPHAPTASASAARPRAAATGLTRACRLVVRRLPGNRRRRCRTRRTSRRGAVGSIPHERAGCFDRRLRLSVCGERRRRGCAVLTAEPVAISPVTSGSITCRSSNRAPGI